MCFLRASLDKPNLHKLEDLLKSEAFKKLSDLNDEDRSGKRQYENDKVYFCDDIESKCIPI